MERLRTVLPRAAAIIIAGLWIYSPAYHGDWLWDDDVLLTRNETVQTTTPGALLKLWFNPDGLDYFPLSYTLLWLQWPFFGQQSTGYHVTTILLHVVSGLLLWTLLERMKIPGAWAAAFLFTIHPACVESVAWVSETKNTLSLALFLASCIFWVAQDDEQPGPKRERLFLGALAFFLLAMFAKTSVVAMPVLTLLHAWWKRGTISKHDAIRAAPMFLISLVLGIITIQYQHGRAIGAEKLLVGGIDSRIAIAGMALLFYLATIVWPVNLLPIYPVWKVDPPRAWQFLPWIVFGAAGWWLWRNRALPWARNTIFALGFFVLMIAPVLGFVNISYMRIGWVADHFLYLPMIGPLVLIVAGARSWLETRQRRERTVFTALAAGLMLLLALDAFFYATAWMDEEHLWEHTLAHNHDAWQAHNRLGAVKLAKGDLEAAHYHFRSSSQLRPDLGETTNNLALVLMKKGRTDEAIRAFEAAKRASPHLKQIWFNLADAYAQTSRYAEARAAYRELLELEPRSPALLHNYAIAVFQTGDKEQAIAVLRKAVEIDPDFKPAINALEQLRQR
jgi:tetratricopeptide (TPR) repeat protein